MTHELDLIPEENKLPRHYLHENIVLLITFKIFQLLRQPEPTIMRIAN